MRKRFSLSLWSGGLALMGTLAAGCAHYRAHNAPAGPVANFGSITLGRFSADAFMAGLVGTDRYAPYLPVTARANRAVTRAVRARLADVPVTPGGPPMVLSAVLTRFATGSGAARALGWVGLVPQGAGDGVIEYRVSLWSGRWLAATYTVRRTITGGSEGAYQAEAKDIVDYLRGNQ